VAWADERPNPAVAPPKEKPKTTSGDKPKTTPGDQPAAKADDKLPLCGLAPAKVVPNLCSYRYRVATNSPECQTFFDQGLAFFYSYVWMEAARSFETAAKYDPNCAMAWWGLSRAMEKWQKGDHNAALKKAKETLKSAGHREQMLITSRLQEKGMFDGVTPETRKSAAQKTLDELLTLHDDDQEAWFCRAQISDGPAAIPYYKALLRLNPIHPGATHELVHYYENIRRPALGWPYAQKYMESSPGLAHPFHMQAHLAMRIGKWEKTTDWSAQAIEIQREFQKFQGVKPSDDWQWPHHLEILTLSLIHDGRFAEARKIKDEANRTNVKHWLPWFRLHLFEGDAAEVQTIIDHYRKREKQTAAYLSALLAMQRNDLARAAADVEVLRQASPSKRRDNQSELRFWEVQGMLLCRTGSPDEGLKLLQRAVDKTKNDFRHHAWGNGAYYMEEWGRSALLGNRLTVAEEGFLEALAHDPGSVRGALGMAVVCELQGRLDEARHFEALAQKCWRKADPGRYDALRAEYRQVLAHRTEASKGAPAADSKPAGTPEKPKGDQ
jgi:tetratricopeptide (TPR) repeat protein